MAGLALAIPLLLAACGSSSGSSAKAGTASGGSSDSTAVRSSAADQSGASDAAGGSTSSVPSTSTGGSGGAASTSSASSHGGATTTAAHAAPGSSAAPAATSTTTTTTTTSPTSLDTIKPIPGRPAAPYFNADYTYATPGYEKVTDAYGTVQGVCGGSPARTEVQVYWSAYNTDFVELDRGSTNYGPGGEHQDLVVDCPPAGLFSAPSVEVQITAFGPGGEVSQEVSVRVSPTYRP